MASTDHELQQAKAEVERLRQHMQALFERTRYEDLEHAGLGLDIVVHALEETLEHTGLSGHIPRQPDVAAHQQVAHWLAQVQGLRREAQEFLVRYPNEDLDTALKALEIAQGSLHEAADRYAYGDKALPRKVTIGVRRDWERGENPGRCGWQVSYPSSEPLPQ